MMIAFVAARVRGVLAAPPHGTGLGPPVWRSNAVGITEELVQGVRPR